MTWHTSVLIYLSIFLFGVPSPELCPPICAHNVYDGTLFEVFVNISRNLSWLVDRPGIGLFIAGNNPRTVHGLVITWFFSCRNARTNGVCSSGLINFRLLQGSVREKYIYAIILQKRRAWFHRCATQNKKPFHQPTLVLLLRGFIQKIIHCVIYALLKGPGEPIWRTFALNKYSRYKYFLF